MKKYIAAVDLGTTKVITLIGEKTSSGKVHVLAHCEEDSSGIIRGDVLNISEVAAVVNAAVAELKQLSGEDISEVYIGVAGQKIRCDSVRRDSFRDNPKKEIGKEEIRQMERNVYHMPLVQGEKIFHVVPQSYNVDSHCDVNPDGMLGHKVEALFKVLVGMSTSEEYSERAIERSGLKLKGSIFKPVATADAVLDEEEKEVGVVMVDIGGGTTDVVIYHDNIVRYSAVIPFGGKVITEDIHKGCGILPRQAEQLKVQHGSCFVDYAADNKIVAIPGINGREAREVSYKFLASIIEARMDEIIEAVQYHIECSGYDGRLPAGIVLTGGSALLGHLPEFVKYKTGLEVRCGKPLFLTADSNTETNHCTYATAVGILMKGFEHEEKMEHEVVLELEPVTVEAPKPPEEPTAPKVKSRKEPKASKSSKGGLGGFIKGLFDDLDNGA